jgi:hypothetical protein
LTAYNAKWSAYGEYLQRMIEATQSRWERLILRSSSLPNGGASVRVVFTLNAAGEVSEVVRVEGIEDESARRLCVSAITEQAHYDQWTPDMIAMLGREQKITFVFRYP